MLHALSPLKAPWQTPEDGFAETSYDPSVGEDQPYSDEIHLKGIIHDYSDREFRLYIHRSSGRCFLIAERAEIRKYMTLKLETCTWSCPMEVLEKYLSHINGTRLAEATLTICKIFQEKYSYFGRYHEHDYVWAFDKFMRHLIPVNRRYEMIYYKRTTNKTYKTFEIIQPDL